MSTADSPAKPSLPETSAQAVPLGVRLVHVAWMSILLGLIMELVIIAVVTIDGSSGDGTSFFTDAVQKVTWSSLVCVGLALGTAASGAVRAPVMGLIGLLMAPLAFTLARMLHNAALQLMHVAPRAAAVSTPSVLWLAVIKAVEFGALGFAAGLLARNTSNQLRSHVLLGLAVGLIFGGILLVYTAGASDPALAKAKLVGLGLNELLYPIGCSMILYAAGSAGRLSQAIDA
jgi:hypothetical protein